MAFMSMIIVQERGTLVEEMKRISIGVINIL
jgi:hypothetical protein